ncbi:hypothetical protein [Parvularcula marina]|uniref:hypothetical protein n=1 Tax=Parvularcula marina TaxID=2292771 RepID=UPI001F15F7C7|nr:hypothetical protein [Parvularcula marina]
MQNVRIGLLICLSWLGLGPAWAQSCDPTPERHAVRIDGRDSEGKLSPAYLPYVAGDEALFQQLDNGWVFALMPVEEGYVIRLFENAQIGMATDLTSLTPPHYGVPNPRDLFGWHFRNADNTGPNDGSVNAPQEMRAFVISPALVGTGGYKPSPDPSGPRLMEPGPDDGIGWLKVIDYGLSGHSLAKGQRARMNYVKFEACLSWPRGNGERDKLLDEASFEFLDEDREAFGGCGLDLGAYDLEARYLPRKLGGDIDGDDALDEVAQVKRKSDGKRALALCRAGTWMSLIGVDEVKGDMPSGYVDQAEAWHWIAPGEGLPMGLGEVSLPEADGAVLLLERIEKQLVAVYWKDGALHADELYHIVEP